MATEKLTDAALRGAKPRTKAYKLPDGKGLHLLIDPNGTRAWRFRYRFLGTEKMLSLGVYPEVSLKDARARLAKARSLLGNGIDPSAQRKAERMASSVDTFEAVAREWLETKRKELSSDTWQRDHDQIAKMVCPKLGSRPVGQLRAPELLPILKALEAADLRDTAHRVRAVVGRVMRYAVATGRAEHDITADLKGALAAKGTQSYAAITDPGKLALLLWAIDGYRDAQPTTRAA